MKPRLAALCFVGGIICLLLNFYFKFDREREWFLNRIETERLSIVQSWERKWQQVNEVYKLEYNLSDLSIEPRFFPFKEGNADWKVYRELLEDRNYPAVINFLLKTMEDYGSQDRIIAIKEYKRYQNRWPQLDRILPYEETIFSDEAKASYGLILDFFEKHLQYRTFMTKQWKDFGIYARITTHEKNNDPLTSNLVFPTEMRIEAAVPSSEGLKSKILPEFLRIHKIPSAVLGDVPWKISFTGAITPGRDFSVIETFLIVMFFVGFLSGVLIYLSGLADQRRKLLRQVTFLNQVVHELRTPLAGMKLHAQLLSRKLSENKSIQAINGSVERLENLFTDILLINRGDKPSYTTCNSDELNSMLLQLKEDFGSRLKIHGEFQKNIVSDIRRIRIILKNLVSNGIRYGKRTELTITESDSSFKIRVEDEGPGVESKDKDKIFQEFYRSQSAQNLSADGMGIGLSIVKRLANDMEARVTLENPGQKGAIFSFEVFSKADEVAK